MLDLSVIRVLWREPDTLALWGIPYAMRPGQQPYDLWKAYHHFVHLKPGHYGSKQIDISNWQWLGTPGWYGDLNAFDIWCLEAFLRGKEVPDNPCEWTKLA